jgi:outer membrane receptor protein involved in Fe transport
VGGVFEPRALEGLTIQIDWFHTTIKDAISNIGADDILSYCYLAALNPTASTSGVCSFVERNPLTGGLVGNPNFGLNEQEQNIASLEGEGVDFDLDYSLDLGSMGNLEIDWKATKVIKNNNTPFAGAAVNVCKSTFGPICDNPTPSVKWVQRTTWYIGDFNIGYRWRYLRGTHYEDLTDSDGNGAPDVCNDKKGYCFIGDVHYVDIVLGWTPTGIDALNGFTFQVGLENLFDKDPPIVGSEAGTTIQNSGNTFPGTFETVGRSLTIRASKKF